MDFSTFSDDAFNAKTWVNNALMNHKTKDEEGIDTHATMLVMKLQLHSLELTNSLEETTSQALLSIPRAIREIDKVRKEATTLKQKMIIFKEQLVAMEGNTDTSVEILDMLDKVKDRMELCMRALKEASKLASFGQNIESVFTSGDYLKIATTIRDLRDSLQIVGSVPEFKDQAHQLSMYQDRLEGVLRPQLLAAINKRQEDVTVSLREVFNLIDRLDQFQQHYISCRQVPLRQAWDSYTPDTPFPTWLPIFYDQLQNSLASDATWAQKIFPVTSQYQLVVTKLIVTSLRSLSTSFQSRLESTLFPSQHRAPPGSPFHSSSIHHSPIQTSHNPSHPSTSSHTPSFTPQLNLLIASYAVANSFAAGLGAIVPDPKNRTEVIQAIFEPFIPFQKKYPNYEKQTLFTNVATIKPILAGFLDTVKTVGDNIGKVFIFAEAAIERCIQFTHGVASEGLIGSLSDFFIEYIHQLFTLVQYLRLKARLEPDTSLGVPPPNSVAPEPHGNDSIYFEGALKLFHAANLLSQRIVAFDKYVRSHLLDQKALLHIPSIRIGEQTLTELQLRNDVQSSKNLEKFFHVLETSTTRVLPLPCLQTSTFNAASQTLVFDIMFAYVKDRINTVPTLEDWRAVPRPNDAGLDLPAYLHPLGYITQIGDHLITTLPQQLEPYADSLARPLTSEDKARSKLTPSITPAVTPRVSSDPLPPSSSLLPPSSSLLPPSSSLLLPSSSLLPPSSSLLLPSLSSSDPFSILSQLQRNPLASNTALPNPDGEKEGEKGEKGEKGGEKEGEEEEEGEGEEEEEGEGEEEEEEGTVAHQWIATIAKGAMALYVKKILDIPVLTRGGAKQLDTDIGYLFKVLSALDVEPDGNLVEVQRLVTVPTEEFAEVVSTLEPSHAPLATAIGNMRGIKV